MDEPTEFRKRLEKQGFAKEYDSRVRVNKKQGMTETMASELAIGSMEGRGFKRHLDSTRSLTTKNTGKKASAHQEITWVLDNLNADVIEDEAPSAKAWNLLIKARDSGDVEKELWKVYFAKGVPVAREADLKDAFLDDGRKKIGILDRIIQFNLEAIKEADGRSPVHKKVGVPEPIPPSREGQ